MTRVLGVLAATLACASVAGAQASVNYTTRTATASSSATVPATPGQVTSSSTTMTGSLDTHTLSSSDLSNLVYRFQFSVNANASGVTDPTACCLLSGASIWMNGHVDDTQLWTSGMAGDFHVYENGYGNEFLGWRNTQGNYDLPFAFVGTNYSLYLNANTPLAGQGAGASGSASATATLVGAFVLNSDGTVRNAATFDDQGHGYFAATTAPEPSSLALLIPGLFGIVPFARKRRTGTRA